MSSQNLSDRDNSCIPSRRGAASRTLIIVLTLILGIAGGVFLLFSAKKPHSSRDLPLPSFVEEPKMPTSPEAAAERREVPLPSVEMPQIDIASFRQTYALTVSELAFKAPPKVRGMNYFAETMDGLVKEDVEIRNDFRVIKQVLNAQAVRLWGFDDSVFTFVDRAHEEDLQVWLTYQPFFEFPNMTAGEYKMQLASFARQAERHHVEVLIVGNELHNWASAGLRVFPRQFIDEVAQIARTNYRGNITYATDDWEGSGVNWALFDIIAINAYLGTSKPEDYAGAIKNTKTKLRKPLYITEVGSLTIADAEKGGGDYAYVQRTTPMHDEVKQASEVARQLDLIYQTGIDGVFVFTWDENARSLEYDKNKFAYGIWDHVEKRPKKAFFEVYKYFSSQ